MVQKVSSIAAFAVRTTSLVACIRCARAFSPIGPIIGAPSSPSSSPSPWTLFMALQRLDDSNMNDLLFRPSDGRAVLVDACAPWCGPCKLIEPYLEDCANIRAEKLSIIKYDVEGNNNKNLKIEMLLQGIVVRGLPTLILYVDGVPLATRSGAIKEKDLMEWLDSNLASSRMNDAMETDGQIRNGRNPKERSSNKVATVRKRGFVSFALEKDDYTL